MSKERTFIPYFKVLFIIIIVIRFTWPIELEKGEE